MFYLFEPFGLINRIYHQFMKRTVPLKKCSVYTTKLHLNDYFPTTKTILEDEYF